MPAFRPMKIFLSLRWEWSFFDRRTRPNSFHSLSMFLRRFFDKTVIDSIFPFSSWTQTCPTFVWTPLFSDFSEDAVTSLEEPLHWIPQSRWKNATTNRKIRWIFLIISWHLQDLISDPIFKTQKIVPRFIEKFRSWLIEAILHKSQKGGLWRFCQKFKGKIRLEIDKQNRGILLSHSESGTTILNIEIDCSI
jgi:hypothetical protein